MKTKIALSLAVSLLITSQASFAQKAAAHSIIQQKNNTFQFMPDPGQSSECMTTPAPLKFSYKYNPSTNQTTLEPRSPDYGSMNAEAYLRVANTTVFTDSILKNSDKSRPLHVFVKVDSGAAKGHGVYWFYTTKGGATPCRGSVDFKINK